MATTDNFYPGFKIKCKILEAPEDDLQSLQDLINEWTHNVRYRIEHVTMGTVAGKLVVSIFFR